MTHDAAAGHDSPEAIRREIRTYLTVFAGLAVLTVITVGACFGLKLPAHQAIAVALVIATIKGSLVAVFFMHLRAESRWIYAILGLTVVFFGLLIWGPVHDVLVKFTY